MVLLYFLPPVREGTGYLVSLPVPVTMRSRVSVSSDATNSSMLTFPAFTSGNVASGQARTACTRSDRSKGKRYLRCGIV